MEEFKKQFYEDVKTQEIYNDEVLMQVYDMLGALGVDYQTLKQMLYNVIVNNFVQPKVVEKKVYDRDEYVGVKKFFQILPEINENSTYDLKRVLGQREVSLQRLQELFDFANYLIKKEMEKVDLKQIKPPYKDFFKKLEEKRRVKMDEKKLDNLFAKVMNNENIQKYTNEEKTILSYLVLFRYLMTFGNDTFEEAYAVPIYSEFQIPVIELFASPLNNTMNNFYSLFYDVDKYFGSKGNAFERLKRVRRNDFFVAKPPYNLFMMEKLARHSVEAMRQEECSFLIFLEANDEQAVNVLAQNGVKQELEDNDAFEILQQSGFCRLSLICTKEQFKYINYSKIVDDEFSMDEVYNTRIVYLSSENVPRDKEVDFLFDLYSLGINDCRKKAKKKVKMEEDLLTYCRMYNIGSSIIKVMVDDKEVEKRLNKYLFENKIVFDAKVSTNEDKFDVAVLTKNTSVSLPYYLDGIFHFPEIILFTGGKIRRIPFLLEEDEYARDIRLDFIQRVTEHTLNFEEALEYSYYHLNDILYSTRYKERVENRLDFLRSLL